MVPVRTLVWENAEFTTSPDTPDRDTTPSTEVSDRKRALCGEFEAAWQAGRAPQIDDYVPRLEAASDDARRQLLVELVRIDLHHRWRTASAIQQDGSTVSCVATRFKPDRSVASSVPGAGAPAIRPLPC